MRLPSLPLISLIALAFNVVYILIVDTTSLHGLSIPNVLIWTIILQIALTYAIYAFIRDERIGKVSHRIIWFGIILAFIAGFLKLINYTSTTMMYQVILIISAFSAIVGLVLEKEYKYLPYVIAYFLAILNYTLNRMHLNDLQFILGPVFELSILVAICYYFYQKKINKLELVILIVAAALGFVVGYLISSFDVAPLILKTIFEQVLGVSQYSFTLFTVVVRTKDFFALHFALIFSLGVFMLLRKESKVIFAVVISGFDISFPPQLAFRSLALHFFLKKKDTD